MFQYRQVLVRLRAGDTVREIARSGLMGRDKLGELRAVAAAQGWLDASAEVPDDQAIIAALEPSRRASSTVSSAEPHRAAVKAWLHAGVQGRAIHAALQREHAYTGSYSAVVRMLRQLRGEMPPEVTVRLSFAPAEVAQVDFGAGPVLIHPDGKPRRTWAFVMTLCHSRHQYVGAGVGSAIKGEKTLAELAKMLDVHPQAPNQINDWKNQLLERAPGAFDADSTAPPAVDLKELHAKTGQLALENGSGGAHQAGMLSAKR